MFYSIYAESTPNPEVMKFVSNRMLADKSIEFLTDDDAKQIPMIYKIFSLDYVESVFLSSNFISIKKKNDVEWGEVLIEIRNFITTLLNEDDIQNYTENIIVKEKEEVKLSPKNKQANTKRSHEENEIIQILDEYIRPAVEGDGGAIHYSSYSDGKLTVVLKGACSGCPSSTVTLKQGIQALFERMLPEVKEVIAEEQ